MTAFFELEQPERREVLEIAAHEAGRPLYILEKDVWVVRVLSLLFDQSDEEVMTFKGGTSLSKGYGLIHRFSEDVDLTVDIRRLIPELSDFSPDPVPESNSQAKKWRRAVESALPDWISEHVLGTLRHDLDAVVEQDGSNAIVTYDVVDVTSDYVAPRVLLEFGARSTGEPSETRAIECDAASLVPSVTFPSARVKTMKPERSFWEKATAIHAFIRSGKVEADRLSRHWYDLAMLSRGGVAEQALADRSIAQSVAAHKSSFFRVRQSDGHHVDYHTAVNGEIQLVPEGEARERLNSDYRLMIDSGLIDRHPPSFDELLGECEALELRIAQV